mmetsp:Transcript_43983/g.76624  ORF Transcript_43983/g.76624 Transcript_43983/m.76624 type:complete len:314 (+) Transcript_43983:481-1422(+)
MPHLLEPHGMGAHRVEHGVQHLVAVAAHGGIVGDFDQLEAARRTRLERIGEALAGIYTQTNACLVGGHHADREGRVPQRHLRLRLCVLTVPHLGEVLDRLALNLKLLDDVFRHADRLLRASLVEELGKLRDELGRDGDEVGRAVVSAHAALHFVFTALENSLEVLVAHQALVHHANLTHEVVDLLGSERNAEVVHATVELRAGHQTSVRGVHGAESVVDQHADVLQADLHATHHRLELHELELVACVKHSQQRHRAVDRDLAAATAAADLGPPLLTLHDGVVLEHTQQHREAGVLVVRVAVHEAERVDHRAVL